ncbi:HNH endonuclease signature motif containing protein [Tabrizicola aquatica]|uniref:HNH endonuclease signature motif containing protein n=1 Tax=Tabrizicola aquatica TaxID=909926 RepID=UPI000CD2F019|nr:HNH endonuclease signature motif containing protein [Tabrizicola aquatica]
MVNVNSPIEESNQLRSLLSEALALANSADIRRNIIDAIELIDAREFAPKAANQRSPLGFYCIPDFPKYVVDSKGRVFGLFRKKLLNPWRSPEGYLRVDIRNGNGQQKKPYVHELVAAAFIGPKPKGMLIRHLNDDPSDNRVENLAYGTQSENTTDSIVNGRNRSKFSTDQISHMLQLRESGRTVEDIMELYPCSMRTMTKILTGSLHSKHGAN